MNGAVTKSLSESRMYRSYTKAFRELSGLSLRLRPIDASALPRERSEGQKWSCAVLGQPRCGCKSCAKGFERIARGNFARVTTMRCGCRCCGAAMPVRSGNDIVALLQIGTASDEGSCATAAKSN